jgi:hypothetical protein
MDAPVAHQAFRRPALEVGDLDAQGVRQKVSGAHAGAVAGFDPPNSGPAHTDLLGELRLGEAALDAPVDERGELH